jgi:hypothetical protein
VITSGWTYSYRAQLETRSRGKGKVSLSSLPTPSPLRSTPPDMSSDLPLLLVCDAGASMTRMIPKRGTAQVEALLTAISQQVGGLPL